MLTSIRRIGGLAAMLLAGGAVALALGVAPGGAARASNSVTYQDSPGQDPAAIDVQQVVVSNDDNGTLMFEVRLGNAAALTGNNDISVFIDSDANSGTGDGQLMGADMVLDVSGGSVDLAKWNGSTFAFGSSPSSLVYSFVPGVLTVKVNANDLGLTSFNFFVVTATDYTDANAHFDIAPDPGHGTYAFQLKIAPPTTSTTTTTVMKKKKVVPKCRKAQKSTRAHPCHR